MIDMESIYWNWWCRDYWKVGTELSDLWYCVSGLVELNRWIIYGVTGSNESEWI